VSQSAKPNLPLSEAERSALGSFRSFHPAPSGIHKVNIVIASIFVLLPLGAAVWVLIEMLRQPGEESRLGVAVLGFGIVALAPALGVAYLVFKLYWKLYLFENGFVLWRGVNRIVLWEDVQYFFEQQDIVVTFKADRWLRFRLRDGRLFTVDSSYQDFLAFTEGVRDAVTRTVLAHAAVELPAGRAVAFGKLMLLRSGLEKPEATLAWSEVHSIAIELRSEGSQKAYVVVIYQRSQRSTGPNDKVEWYKRFVVRFPNFVAFVRLASEFTTVIGPGAYASKRVL
jgi:hypothetical protein